MTKISEELKRLHQEILSEDEAERHRFQPKLAAMIEALHAKGAPVPPHIRDLNEDLISDAMEAQFDNIPL